ncbi:hypothetical protein MANES_09G116450v8 [Manihot esculenta]|uniref:Uncharacterized protein n=1 Tax=Manihot esculenta TaxID=3983 RepID=A0ACB7H539_MANES|nr:hypothetical protein MANES_09G116450v8 [Manihot esculenta]
MNGIGARAGYKNLERSEYKAERKRVKWKLEESSLISSRLICRYSKFVAIFRENVLQIPEEEEEEDMADRADQPINRGKTFGEKR